MKLWIDVTQYVSNDVLKQLQQDNEGEVQRVKPRLKCFIAYPEGSQIGEHDIFAELTGLTSVGKGHDSTSIGDNICSIFTMPRSQIEVIKARFMPEYKEMKDKAI